MTPLDAAARTRAHLDAASARYARIRQIRGVVVLIDAHSKALHTSMFGEFFGWAGGWYRNELLLEVSKAFDPGNDRTLSVRRGLKFLLDHAARLPADQIAPKMLDAWILRNGTGVDTGLEVPAKVRACAQVMVEEVGEHAQPLRAIKAIRDRILAHHDRRGAPPDVGLIWGDITRAQELILQFIDLCVCLVEGGGYGVTRDGEYDVGNTDYPQHGLSNLFDVLFRSRVRALPEGYSITANGPRVHNPRVWEVLDPSGRSVHLAHDAETAALTAWMHSTGADVSRRMQHPDRFSLDFQR